MNSQKMELLEEALAMHARHGVVDLHADPLLWSRMAGYDIVTRHRNPLPRSPFFRHSDLPRWQESHVRLVILGVVTLPSAIRRNNFFNQALNTLQRAHRAEVNSNRDFRVVESALDFAEAERGKIVGGMLSIEGAQPLDGSFDKLDELCNKGLRAVGLAHFHSNAAVSPSYGRGGDRGPLSKPNKAAAGLSDFGRQLIAELNKRKMPIDLAHCSRSGFFETCQLSTQPVFVSHTGVQGAHNHWRNIDDEQLKAIADSNGIVGIIVAGKYLGGNQISDVVRHIEHVINCIGEDHVALGSDFDGMIVPVKGLEDVAELPRLTAELIARGHAEERIAKFLSGNAFNYLRQVTGWDLTLRD